MNDKLSAFSCPPGKQATCEHVWDGPGIEILSDCRDCGGLGIIAGDGEEVLCEKCDGKGTWVSGDSSTCSKCGMDAMTYSLWEGE